MDWTICDSLKGRIDTFKRTMPLIQDLKNPAMRDRPWQQLKQEIQKPFDHTSQCISKLDACPFDVRVGYYIQWNLK